MNKTTDAHPWKNSYLTEHTHTHIKLKTHLRKLIIMIKK